MSYILIHSNNTSLIKSKYFGIDKSVTFDPDPYKDIDLYISEFITSRVLQKKPKALFIKYALTNNYISFIGIRLAMHIRLKLNEEDLALVPIIMIGEETIIEISKLSDLASIIGTSGIYHSNENESNIAKYINEIDQSSLTGLHNKENFIERISIPPPSNYTSHHSVTNDWSLIRWAKYLKCTDQIKAESDITTTLYYKYISKKYPINEATPGSNILIPGDGNILIIDDEASKGWQVLYEKIITLNPSIKLLPFEYDFKGKARQQIVSDCMNFIKSSTIDVIILDLRLCDEDFYLNDNFHDLTGFLLLEEIKKYNKGLQTIIVSASNKIWNYTNAIDSFADDYLLKESPENSQDPNHTAQSIKNFRKSVEISLQKKYLKEIWTKLADIKIIFENIVMAEPIQPIKKSKKKFFNEINQFLVIFFDNISHRKAYYGNAFQLLFVVIEILNNDIVDSKNSTTNSSGKHIWQIRRASTNLAFFSKNGNAITKGSDLTTDKRSIPWDQKTFNTAFHLGVDLSNLSNLSKLMDIRHEYIHQDITTGSKVEPTLDNTKELFKIIHLMCINYK